MTEPTNDRSTLVMVDDDLSFPLLLREFFADQFNLISFTRGTNLIPELHRIKPQLIILDVDMPGISGFDLCRQIRYTPGLSAIPILFLTASKDINDQKKASLAEASGYMLKPVEPRQLLSKIHELIGK